MQRLLIAGTVPTESASYLLKWVLTQSTSNTGGEHVPGSPFQFTVGPLGEGGSHKVRAGGTGLERAVAKVPGMF